MSVLKELKALKVKAESSWIEDILKLDPEIQNPVGKIVWWDFFASRGGSDRAVGFNRFLTFDGENYPDDRLKEGLISVGYPREYAASRVLGKGLSKAK